MKGKAAEIPRDVMAVNETDIELLETYLDGELPQRESESLWRRLADEPELSAELEHLRAERAVRQAVFASMEPSELLVSQTQASIARATRRRHILSIVNKALTATVAAAACILFGFAVGWLGHDKFPATLGAASGAGVQVVDTHGSAASGGNYVVNVRDDSGHVVASQTFGSLQEARDFAEDVSRSQVRHHDLHDSPVVPVSDQY
jgi:anti-sigma factor RsiW